MDFGTFGQSRASFFSVLFTFFQPSMLNENQEALGLAQNKANVCLAYSPLNFYAVGVMLYNLYKI